MTDFFSCLAITDPEDSQSSAALLQFDDAETAKLSPDDYDVMQLAASLDMADDFAEWLILQAMRYAKMRVACARDGSCHRLTVHSTGVFSEMFDYEAAVSLGLAKRGGA